MSYMGSLVSETFNICVDDKKIKDGFRFQPRRCPIAMAVNDVMGKAFEIDYEYCVAGKEIRFFVNSLESSNAFVFEMCKQILHWINEYDYGQPVEPINIDLHISSMVERHYKNSRHNREYSGTASIRR